jgi:hypothetical protein
MFAMGEKDGGQGEGKGEDGVAELDEPPVSTNALGPHAGLTLNPRVAMTV